MIDTEVAETLMSLSAPDERKYASPLYADELPWHANKKNAFGSFNASPPSSMPNSLPNQSFMQAHADNFSSFSLLHHKIQERPLTSMIPRQQEEDDDDSDVDMDSQEDDECSRTWPSYRSPFDGLVAAARDHARAASNQDGNDDYSSSSSSSRPIMIPMQSSRHQHDPKSSRLEYGQNQKWGLSQVKEESSYLGLDSSPTGVEEDSAWFDSYRQTSEYKQRVRLASICSSEGSSSEYGGLGRKHLEEFIRMEISAVNEGNQIEGTSPGSESKYIGSYSPEARRKRIERFLEKRKRRVWAKKVDYDVRKNFANSRLRVKGRFVKKEDEELLCQLMSFT